MLRSKKFGLILIIIGAIALGASFYIKQQVLQGREQISTAQKSADVGKGLFSLSPATKPAGEIFGGAAEHKIKAGTAEANRYEKIANGLLIAGIILIIAGIISIFRGRKRA